LRNFGADIPIHRADLDKETTLAALIQDLLDHIRNLDKSMDETRMQKIANIKKALAEGSYNVSADEVARKIIDHLPEI